MTQPTTTATRHAVLYARVASSKPEDNAAIREQLETCRRMAAEHGLGIAAEFVDRGSSGMTLMRPGLAQLLGHIERRPTDVVICADPTRIGRSLKVLQAFDTELVTRDGRLLVVSEGASR